MKHSKFFCKSCLTCCVMSYYQLDFHGLHLKILKIYVFLVVQLYVEMFELVNHFEVLSILI